MPGNGAALLLFSIYNEESQTLRIIYFIHLSSKQMRREVWIYPDGMTKKKRKLADEFGSRGTLTMCCVIVGKLFTATDKANQLLANRAKKTLQFIRSAKKIMKCATTKGRLPLSINVSMFALVEETYASNDDKILGNSKMSALNNAEMENV